MNVRHGSLLHVFGMPAQHSGFTFIPAEVELEGDSFSLEYRLCDQIGDEAPSILRYALSRQFDAAWVRARIPATFGFTPEFVDVEKSLLYIGFVAVPEDKLVGYPFICTDHYGRSALMFSDHGPEKTVKQAIASAFWRLLIEHPVDLADFEERVYHSGAGVWLNYGCKHSHIYCEETVD